ncbi:N-acetyltransferase [bacterium M00.F.Ca.ET.141.01.1.1]|nr:N-acetyltransferase [bacterium M00.F.Ca.ET.141.01.1.1]
MTIMAEYNAWKAKRQQNGIGVSQVSIEPAFENGKSITLRTTTGRQITIRKATNTMERAEAALFATDTINPHQSDSMRLKCAVTYGLQPKRQWHVLSGIDASPIPFPCPSRRRKGSREAPIYTAFCDGELVGAVVCSCVDEILPLRIMMGAVRRDFRGLGIGGPVVRKIVQHLIASAPIVGVSIENHHLRKKAFLTRCGFSHWYGTPSIYEWQWIGFSRPVNIPDGLWYAAPGADFDELEKPTRGFLTLLRRSNDTRTLHQTADL